MRKFNELIKILLVLGTQKKSTQLIQLFESKEKKEVRFQHQKTWSKDTRCVFCVFCLLNQIWFSGFYAYFDIQSEYIVCKDEFASIELRGGCGNCSADMLFLAKFHTFYISSGSKTWLSK